MSYDSNYPTEPIGGSNPYQRCTSCKRSEPEINGDITKHEEWCEYRLSKENDVKAMKNVEAELKIIEDMKASILNSKIDDDCKKHLTSYVDMLETCVIKNSIFNAERKFTKTNIENFIKPLMWSEPKPPDGGKTSFYDNLFADSPLGKLKIEWKSWKDYPDFSLYLDDAFINSFDALEDARLGAIQFLADTVNELLQ